MIGRALCRLGLHRFRLVIFTIGEDELGSFMELHSTCTRCHLLEEDVKR